MCTLQMLLQCGKVFSWLLASVCLRGEDMEEQLHSWNWEQQVRGAVHITADQKVEKKAGSEGQVRPSHANH